VTNAHQGIHSTRESISVTTPIRPHPHGTGEVVNLRQSPPFFRAHVDDVDANPDPVDDALGADDAGAIEPKVARTVDGRK
jgi:hypothetical protein